MTFEKHDKICDKEIAFTHARTHARTRKIFYLPHKQSSYSQLRFSYVLKICHYLLCLEMEGNLQDNLKLITTIVFIMIIISFLY